VSLGSACAVVIGDLSFRRSDRITGTLARRAI
jgi:hypothetical protein